MARMTHKLMVMGLVGLMAAQGAYAASGTAINTNTPTSTLIGPVTNAAGDVLLGKVGVLGNLSSFNTLGLTGLTGDNLGKMLVNAAVTQVTSQLLGKIDSTGILGAVVGGSLSQTLTGNIGGLTSLTGTSLTSSLLTGGIQNAVNSSSLNIGGLVNSAVNGAVNGLVQAAVSQAIGGIQSSSSSSSDSSSSSTTTTTSIGGTTDADAPVLSYTTTIDTTSTNYVSGQYDGAQGLQPDSRFLMSDGNYDSNYWSGYQKALVAASVATTS